jgi:hypothetical protein
VLDGVDDGLPGGLAAEDAGELANGAEVSEAREGRMDGVAGSFGGDGEQGVTADGVKAQQRMSVVVDASMGSADASRRCHTKMMYIGVVWMVCVSRAWPVSLAGGIVLKQVVLLSLTVICGVGGRSIGV